MKQSTTDGTNYAKPSYDLWYSNVLASTRTRTGTNR